MKTLAGFSITVREEDFVLHLVDDTGQTTEFATPPEQLDAIIDALDELLSENEDEMLAGEEGDDGETYQKPLG